MLRHLFHTAEGFGYGLLFPLAIGTFGVKVAFTAAQAIPNPGLASLITENVVPAFSVAASLYLMNRVREALPSASVSFKIALVASAGLSAIAIAGDHMENGPIIKYVHNGSEAHYVVTP